MAIATVLQFMQKTGEDAALRQQLESLLGVGDGNISSSTQLDPEESAALSQGAPRVTEFAAQQGYSFSSNELVQVITAFQQLQSGQLSKEDFARALGFSETVQIKNQAENVLARCAQYLSKTYLGIGK
jgi:hypothetical protein